MSTESYEVDRTAKLVVHEVFRAMQKHGPMRNRHEAYAVILEEMDEFWDEVKKRNPEDTAMLEELVQIAAMAIRAIVDLELTSAIGHN